MRETKFRGKRIDNGKWVYGDLIQYDNNECKILEPFFRQWNILEGGYDVVPESVGQYTTLKDKDGKGKEIYEADAFNNTNKTAIGVVSWFEDKWVVKFPTYQYSLFQFLENDERREVIGNIHENPELLS